jgi:hypothetical protein
VTELPQFLRDMIASPPKHGGADGGVHKWLFRVARQLHCHRDDEEIFKLLKAATLDCGRPVPDREIWAAIKGSATRAWQPRNNGLIDSEPSQGATPAGPAPITSYKIGSPANTLGIFMTCGKHRVFALTMTARTPRKFFRCSSLTILWSA